MKKILNLMMIFSLLSSSLALAEGDNVVQDTKNDLMLVAAAGAGGAVLGLSTLSFYDKPSKHLSNVWMGAALGIIGGVIYVAINHAQKSQNKLALEPDSDFSSSERYSWHQENNNYSDKNDLYSPLWTKNF